jgi:hypothetical protein
VSTTSENERRLWSNVKSSWFLVYKIAPKERALSPIKNNDLLQCARDLDAREYSATTDRI